MLSASPADASETRLRAPPEPAAMAYDSPARIRRPIGHDPTAALEQVGAHVGGLDRVPHDMGQGRLVALAGVVRLFGDPVPERRPEPIAAPPRSRAS